MPPVIEIVEILGPSQQGFTKPFLCRGEDGELYYVKGRGAQCVSWWSEWICAHAGREFGLNIPAFSLVHIDQMLLAEVQPAWQSIGAGCWFGSRKHPVAAWFEPSQVTQVPLAVRRDLVVFDWWIHNMDRSLGNTNLLWDPGSGALVVIDHNQAFDRAFTEAEFLEYHLFREDFEAVRRDLVLQAEYGVRLTKAAEVARLACNNAPSEWRWSNEEQDLPCSFDVEAALRMLERCATDELWRSV